MPRRSTPPIRHRHTRLHVREQADRYRTKRWDRLRKEGWTDTWIPLDPVSIGRSRAVDDLRRTLPASAWRFARYRIERSDVRRLTPSILKDLWIRRSSLGQLDQRFQYGRCPWDERWDEPDVYSLRKAARKRRWQAEASAEQADWRDLL